MWKFFKYYALEIYTVITMLMITLMAMFMDNLYLRGFCAHDRHQAVPAVNHLGAWYDYVFGPLLFFPCFMCLQKTLTMMVGIRYRDLPKKIKAILQNRK